jgi:hypothetical protein
MSHDDLGEIRTETAIRSTPPEKKERLGVKGCKRKTPWKLQGAAGYIFVIEIQSKSPKFNFKNFK